MTWITASEENVSHFEVEKSIDGLRFETIGEVLANGNTNSLQSYTILDEYVAELNNYYRLKIFDLDGHFELSDVIHLKSSCFNDIDAIALYPNPVKRTGDLTLRIESSTVDLETELVIFDIQGKLVIKETIEVEKGDNIFKLNINHLSSGNYFLRIKNENISESLPFIVIQD